MTTDIRDARIEDADMIGRVHVRAWRAAYRGILSDAYLATLDERVRANGWRALLVTPLDRTKKFVVATQQSCVVGFAFVGPDQDKLAIGELYAFYVDPDLWGTGVAQPLLAHATTLLSALGHGEAILWVLRGNARARRFYEQAGWRVDGAEKVIDASVDDVKATFDEVRYGTTVHDRSVAAVHTPTS